MIHGFVGRDGRERKGWEEGGKGKKKKEKWKRVR